MNLKDQKTNTDVDTNKHVSNFKDQQYKRDLEDKKNQKTKTDLDTNKPVSNYKNSQKERDLNNVEKIMNYEFSHKLYLTNRKHS